MVIPPVKSRADGPGSAAALLYVPLVLAARPTAREIHVSVTNGAEAAAQTMVSLQAPTGWKVSPARPQPRLRADTS